MRFFPSLLTTALLPALVAGGLHASTTDGPAQAPPVSSTVELTTDSPETTDDIVPDVAYDSTWNVYLAVWAEQSDGPTGIESRIMGRRVASTGSPLGSPFVISGSASNAYFPRVASVNASNRFLVVWLESTPGLPFDFGDRIHCAIVNASNGTVGTAIMLADSDGTDKLGLSISSESSSSDNDLIAVWSEQQSLLNDPQGVYGMTIDVPFSGFPSVKTEFTVSGSASSAEPAISRSGGTNGRYLITWLNKASSPGGTDSIWGRVMSRDGNWISSSALLDVEPNRNESRIAIDGDGTTFWLAYEDSDVFGSPAGLRAMRVAYSAPFGLLAVADDWTLADPVGSSAIEPTVAWMGGGLVTTSWRQDTGSSDALYYAVHHVDTGIACETATVIAASSDDEQRPRLGGQYSGGGIEGGRALLVWQSDETFFSPFDSDVLARLIDPQDPAGSTEFLGGNCGQGGVNHIVCAAGPGSSTFTHVLDAAADGATAYLLISLDDINASCGSCTLVPNPFTGFVFGPVATDGDGFATIPMPLFDSPALTGVSFFSQWVVQGGAGACSALGADLSTALRITLL